MLENVDRMLIESALPKAEKFCAYQERCLFDVRQKLIRIGLPNRLHQFVLQVLEDKGFINEKRYCELYIRSKIGLKGWGPHKILAELKKKQIADEIILQFLSAVPVEMHYELLRKLLTAKSKLIKSEDDNKKKQKLLRYAIGKGYSFEMALQIIDELSQE